MRAAPRAGRRRLPAARSLADGCTRSTQGGGADSEIGFDFVRSAAISRILQRHTQITSASKRATCTITRRRHRVFPCRRRLRRLPCQPEPTVTRATPPPRRHHQIRRLCRPPCRHYYRPLPTLLPSTSPTASPSAAPIPSPSAKPTASPTPVPIPAPTPSPTSIRRLADILPTLAYADRSKRLRP